MKTLVRKFKNNEYISDSEFQTIKVLMVLVFLFIYGAVAIPVSFITEVTLGFRIIVPVIFVSLYLITLVAFLTERTRLSIQSSILTYMAVTIFYVGFANPILVYLLFYTVLVVIIVFNDIYFYAVYGLSIVIFSVFYIILDVGIFQGDAFIVSENPIWVYIALIVSFYGFFLIYFVFNEIINNDFNHEFIKTKSHIKQYQSFILHYHDDIQDRDGEVILHEDEVFEEIVLEIGRLMTQNMNLSAKTFNEVGELYFALHEYDLQQVIENPNINKITRGYAYQLEKYLLNQNNELWDLIHDFKAKLIRYEDVNYTNFESNIHEIFSVRSRRLIGLAMMYSMLKSETTQYDRWGRAEKNLTHDEIKSLFNSKRFREYINYEELKFFNANEKVFKNFL